MTPWSTIFCRPEEAQGRAPTTALSVPSVVFSPAARAELLEARDWYAARDVELADRFIAETETIVERIGTEPQQLPVVYQDTRRARCRRFRTRYSFGSSPGPCA